MKYAIAVLLVSLSFFQAGCGGCGRGYSKGQRVGVVFKYSNKGLFCKTWEGSANLGGMREQATADGKGTQIVPNTWNFTVTDEDAAKFGPIINESLEHGKTLKFTYDQELIALCNSEDGYFVTNVEVVKP